MVVEKQVLTPSIEEQEHPGVSSNGNNDCDSYSGCSEHVKFKAGGWRRSIPWEW